MLPEQNQKVVLIIYSYCLAQFRHKTDWLDVSNKTVLLRLRKTRVWFKIHPLPSNFQVL